MHITTTSSRHCCQPPYLLALPVSLSFPLARLLTAGTAFGPGSLTFTPCCPPPRRQVGNAMQEQAEPVDGPLKGPTSLYHWKVLLEGEASEDVCILYIYFLKYSICIYKLGLFLLCFLFQIPIITLNLIPWIQSPLCCSWKTCSCSPLPHSTGCTTQL